MGIPYFYGYLYKKYKYDIDVTEDVLKNKMPKYLFFDYNSLIHPCANNVLEIIKCEIDSSHDIEEIEERIISNTIKYTEYVINLFKDSLEKVYITIDGVAPLGKLKQQRERRYKSYYTKETVIWDTNNITPGTKFMEKLEKSLEDFANKFDGSINVILDSWRNVGEGEHKMMNTISKLSRHDDILVYGLDGDLIVLGMLADKKITLIRADNHDNTKFNYLETNKLGELILKEVGNVKDFILLSFLLGNDFIPSLPNLNIRNGAIDYLIKIYKTLSSKHESIINEYNNINMDFLLDILSMIASNEDYYFTNVMAKCNIHAYSDNKEYLQNPRLTINTNDYIKYGKHGYKSRYYTYYNMINSKYINGDNHIIKICYDYIKTIKWVWEYYNLHKHSNWDWYYKHSGAPFASDFSRMSEHYSYKGYLNEIDFYESTPFDCVTQLIIVLPYESLMNINYRLRGRERRIIEGLVKKIKDHDLYRNVFPDNIFVDMINKQYLWQGYVFFENIDIESIRWFSKEIKRCL